MSIKTTVMWFRTGYRRIISRAKCAAERETLVATFCVNGSQQSIEVTAPYKFKGDSHNMWGSIIHHCSDVYSPNELIEINAQLWQKLKERSAGDIPSAWQKMFDELTEAMKKRGIQF